MFVKAVVMFGISLFLLFVPVHSLANESRCLTAYNKVTIAIENAASAQRAGDACRAADGIEDGLNWIGTCETECAYSRERMNKVEQTKRDLIRVLPVYIKQCGH